MPKHALRCVGSLAVLAVSPGVAWAAEYCVTCEGPAAMYRCVVEGTADGPGKDPRGSLNCISEMATRGRHETCSVSRGAPFPCPGLTVMVKDRDGDSSLAAQPPSVVPREQDADVPPPAAPESLPPPAPTDADAAPDQGPEKVPHTMEELAGQTVKSSKETIAKAGEQIGNAGSAIGSAASKTWNCISSLFTSCISAPQPAEAPPKE